MVQPAKQSLGPTSSTVEPPVTRTVMEEPARKGGGAAPASPGKPGVTQGGPAAPWPGGPGGSGPPRKRKIAWGWIIAALVIVGLLIYAVIPHGGAPGGQAGPGGGRGGRGGPGGPGGGAPVSVNTAKVTATDVPIYLSAIGTATPTATVTVRPQAAGQLTKIAFQEGQMVKAGQFLAEIDPRPAQQALAQAEALQARDEANLTNAKVLLQRDQTLLAQDSIARQDVDNQAAAVRQLEATIKSDQAAIGQARLSLAYTHITAPVAGRVGLRQVDVGNYVTVGQTTGLVVITQVAPIDVLFTLPEDNLPQVTARLRTGASLPAVASDRAQSTELAHGKLLTLDNLIDTTTGTVKVKARFANTDGALFPNQFVNMKILVDTLKGATTVPSSAVLRGANGLIVYVVNADRTVSVRNVVPGPVAGQVTAINSGLKLGETVVIDGTDRLKEGSRVTLPGECPPAGGFGGRSRRGQGGPGGQGGARQGGQGQNAQGGQGFGGAGRRVAGGAGGAGGFANCRPAGAGGAPGAAGPGGRQGGGFAGAPRTGVGPAAAGTGAIPSTATRGGPQGDRQPGANPEAAQGAAPGGGQAGGFAGRQGGGFGGPGGGGGGMRLFSQLGLTPDQTTKITAILQEGREKAQTIDDPDARRQAIQGANQRAEALLTPAQKTKYEALRAAARAQFGGGGGGGGGGGFGGGGQGGAGQN